MTRPFANGWMQLPQTTIDYMRANNQYFGLYPSGTCVSNVQQYGFAIYNANGTQAQILHSTGTITGLDAEMIFYLGSGTHGTILTPSMGYSYGDSAIFNVADRSVTCADTSTYVPPSTTPLGDGEAASSGQTLSGIIFEDINYGGGAGRSQAASAGAGVNGARVELYGSTGTLLATTTTANDGTNNGAYSFASLADGNYYVRVVNSSNRSAPPAHAAGTAGNAGVAKPFLAA